MTTRSKSGVGRGVGELEKCFVVKEMSIEAEESDWCREEAPKYVCFYNTWIGVFWCGKWICPPICEWLCCLCCCGEDFACIRNPRYKPPQKKPMDQEMA